MITGGHNVGRVGVIVSRERHPGSFDIVHVKDTLGHTFATRLNNVFVIGKASERDGFTCFRRHEKHASKRIGPLGLSPRPPPLRPSYVCLADEQDAGVDPGGQGTAAHHRRGARPSSRTEVDPRLHLFSIHITPVIACSLFVDETSECQSDYIVVEDVWFLCKIVRKVSSYCEELLPPSCSL